MRLWYNCHSEYVSDTVFAFSFLFKILFFIFHKFLITCIHDCLERIDLCGWMKSIIIIQQKVTKRIVHTIIIFWWYFASVKNFFCPVKRFNRTLVLWVIRNSKNMLNLYLKPNSFIILFSNSVPLSVCRVVGTLWDVKHFLNAPITFFVVLSFNRIIHQYLVNKIPL